MEDRDLSNRINAIKTLPLNQESHGDHFHDKSNEGSEHLERTKHIWNAKIARYLAYIVDGGFLCSQFTLRTFLTLLEQVNDPSGEDNFILMTEIGYLLHIREVGKPYNHQVSVLGLLRYVKFDFSKYTMNFKVLCALIESGFIQKLCSKQDDRSFYPNLLGCIL